MLEDFYFVPFSNEAHFFKCQLLRNDLSRFNEEQLDHIFPPPRENSFHNESKFELTKQKIGFFAHCDIEGLHHWRTLAKKG